MPKFPHAGRILLLAMLFAPLAHAQDAPDAPAQTEAAPSMVLDPMLTTKKQTPDAGNNNAVVAPSPPRNPFANTPSPFGKSTSVQDKQFISGPKATSAVPVESIDAIETGEAAPPEPEEPAANPVKEDPAQPTQLTAPIFSEAGGNGVHATILRVLNKVTARSEKIELKPDTPMQLGKLILTAGHCQRSDPSSLPDEAALVSVSEIIDARNTTKPLFTGWLYQSSPSVNGLEHPIYDVALVNCVGEAKPEIKADKPQKSPKSKKH